MPKGYAPAEIPAEWRDLLLLVPGYDSIATAPADHWFDPDIAQRSIDFFPAFLRHVEGDIKGEPFVLSPWQQAVNANMFGWQRRDEKGREVRRYREVLIYVPRGNGKTAWIAGLCLFVLLCDGEAGAQVYGAAAEREQAAIQFVHARGMVEQHPALSKRCKVFKGTGHRSIVLRNDEASRYKIISAEAFSKHGFNTHAAFVDELHAHLNRDLVDVLKTSMGKMTRKQPLMVYTTTADFDRPSICNQKHEFGDKVRKRIVDDPEFLPVIYEADREDDWKDEKVWAKANPNLGVSVKLDNLRSECKQAQEVPAYENTFRRLYLNQKTSTDEKCIPLEQWDAGAAPLHIAAYAGRTCFLSIDIGAISDFTAAAFLFPHDDAETVELSVVGEDGQPRTVVLTRRSYDLLMRFWVPEQRVRRDARMDAIIDGWIKEGYIRVTPGNSTAYELVLAELVDMTQPFTMPKVALDKGFQGLAFGQNLMKTFGDTVEFFQQGIISMNAPFREFLDLLAAGRLHHDDNPVMRWMVSNVVAEKAGGGLMKPSKKRSPEKIDGVTAAVMSIGIASAGVEAEPCWTPGSLLD